MPQIERKAKLLADIRRRVTERAQGHVVFLLVTLHGDVNAGVPEIVRNSDFGNSNQRQAWILEFVTYDLHDFFAQRFGNALRAMHNCKDEGRRMRDETPVVRPSSSLR